MVQWKDSSTGATETYSESERHAEITNGLTYTIYGLTPGKQYALRVTAVRADNGTAIDLHHSEELTVYRYSWIYLYLDPVAGNAGGLTFYWESLDNAYAGYVLQWREKEATGDPETKFNDKQRVVVTEDAATPVGDPSPLVYHEVLSTDTAEILPNTLYVGRVWAYSEYGSSDAPDGDSATDEDVTHSETSEVTVKPVPKAFDQLDVSWTQGDTTGAWRDITGYRAS